MLITIPRSQFNNCNNRNKNWNSGFRFTESIRISDCKRPKCRTDFRKDQMIIISSLIVLKIYLESVWSH